MRLLVKLGELPCQDFSCAYISWLFYFIDREAVTELDAKLKEERKQSGEMVYQKIHYTQFLSFSAMKIFLVFHLTLAWVQSVWVVNVEDSNSYEILYLPTVNAKMIIILCFSFLWRSWFLFLFYLTICRFSNPHLLTFIWGKLYHLHYTVCKLFRYSNFSSSFGLHVNTLINQEQCHLTLIFAMI